MNGAIRSIFVEP